MKATNKKRRLWSLNQSGDILAITGIIILTVISIMAIAAPLFSSWGPKQIDFSAFLSAPTANHWFGTDGNGMDVWSRILYGARIDLSIGISSVVIAVLVGSTIGSIAGYFGGWMDAIVMRLTDIVQAFPPFILALTVAAMFGRDIGQLVLAISLVFMPAYIRLMRSEIRALRQRSFIEAAECAGNTHMRILVRHLIPNATRPILVIAPLNCGWAILTLAGLSFLGLGIPIPEAEWGAMISAGAADVIGGRWWTSVFPGLILFISVLGFNLIGEGFLERSGQRS